MVGWQYWTYSNVFAGNDFLSTSLIEDLDLPPTPDNIKQPAMDVLARPYPPVVAGTPTGWKWDAGKKEFTLSYSTTGPAGVSFGVYRRDRGLRARRHFPAGYFVGSKGARVVSDPGARLLRLRNCPGAKAASLTVGPVQSLQASGDRVRDSLPGGAEADRSCAGPAGARRRASEWSDRALPSASSGAGATTA